MRLVLVRHAQTPSNVRHLLDTAAPGPGLTELGDEQAAQLPGALVHERVGSLWASTLLRTQLTAQPLAAHRGLDLQVRDGLREISAGELEMRGDEHAVQIYLRTVFAWSDGELGRRMPGGESGEEVFDRFDRVVAEAAEVTESALFVSHGAMIRTWAAARAVNLDTDFAARNWLGNTGIVVLEGDPDSGWRALAWEGEEITHPHPAADETSGPAGEPASRR